MSLRLRVNHTPADGRLAFLMAILRPVAISRPRYTTAYVPSPTCQPQEISDCCPDRVHRLGNGGHLLVFGVTAHKSGISCLRRLHLGVYMCVNYGCSFCSLSVGKGDDWIRDSRSQQAEPAKDACNRFIWLHSSSQGFHSIKINGT